MMTPTEYHVHAPSRRLPCACRVTLPAIVAGDTVTKRCSCRRTWTGTVRPSRAVPTVIIVDWTEVTA